jgi:DNA repair photolyase
MSHPAIASSLPSLSPLSRRGPASVAASPPAGLPPRLHVRALPSPSARPREARRAPASRQTTPPRTILPREMIPQPRTPRACRTSTHPSQLLDWLRLAARQVFGADLEARIEPYRACRCCVAQVRWCGEGAPLVDPRLESFESLESLLSPQGLPGITPLTSCLIVGSMADPYSPAEVAQRRTRRLLERLLAGDPREIASMEISILTRSPLLLRDLDLLVDLDRRHVVTVLVLIPAAEAELASRIEAAAPAPSLRSPDSMLSFPPRAHPSSLRRPASPPSPSSPPCPDARFELVRTLTAHGIATQVLCTPVQPGLNNGAAVLRRLFDRAHAAGARDVCPAPRHPALRPTSAESRQLLGLFHRLRLERGFPRTLPGRG